MSSSAHVEPFCSLIVPTYRRPKDLAGCLEALAALDYPRERFEVIVVDDGGGLGLEPTIAEFRGRLDVTLLVTPRAGPAAARNAGARRAQGELLAFTDDDCRPRPDWLRLLAASYRSEPGAGFGGHTVNALRRNPYGSTGQLIIDVGYAHLNGYGDTARFFTTNNLAVPATRFRELGGFDRTYRTSEDREFCTRWVNQGWKLRSVPAAVVDHVKDLTFSSFCRQHFNYGRGAFRYHHDQARHWNRRVRIDGSYYWRLVRAPFRAYKLGKALRVAVLLGLWHTMNTAGFFYEWSRMRRDARRPAVSGCRVLHLSWSGQIGGIERHLASLARGACASDPRALHVCLIDGRGPVGDELAAEGLATRLLVTRAWSPLGLLSLVRTLRRLRPEVLHLHTHSVAAVAVSMLALRGVPRIYTEHSPRALNGRDRKFRALYWLLRRTCASFVATAPAMATVLERRGVERDSVVHIPYPLSIPGHTGAARDVGATVGVVCRLVSTKRVDVFIDVLAALARRGIDCTGLVVGDGPERAALEAHADARGVADRVRFVGEQTDVVPWLDQIDVFLVTPELEPYGIASLEAMARGVPVVAMACQGGLTDLVGEGGLLLSNREIDSAAAAVAALLASSEARDRLRRRGGEVARAHAPEAVLAKLEDLYRAAAKQPSCHVLHVAWPGGVGGIEGQIAQIARNAPGHRVCFLNGKGAVADALVAEGLAVRLSISRGWSPRSVWRLARTLRRLQPRVVHLHSDDSLAVAALCGLALPRARRVYTERSVRSLRPPDTKERILYWILRRTHSGFVALTPTMAAALERHGVERRSIALIPNALSVPRRDDPDRGRGHTLGVVCRLVSVKRVDLFIDVVRELARRSVDCSALVVGDGVERAPLEAHAVASGVAQRIRFVGTQADVLPWLDEIDVFLATSECEAYGNAAIEAMARGVPVVAMPCAGGLADSAARGGELLPDREVATAADAVERLLTSRDAREELRARGFAVVADRNLDTTLSKFRDFYGNVEHGRAPGMQSA